MVTLRMVLIQVFSAYLYPYLYPYPHLKALSIWMKATVR